MKIKVVACKVFLRKLYRLAADSRNLVDILWMPQRLHERPQEMRTWLQCAITRIEAEEDPYDAIVLAYGLCSNGTVGLRTAKTPLVIVKGHDCITLLLGDRKRYIELFCKNGGGVYWYSQGWMEYGVLPGKEHYEQLYAQYVEKYGEDNALYLLEAEQGWMKNYHKAIYIRWPDEEDQMENKAREAAKFLHWEYACECGSRQLLYDLLEGFWDDQRFLVLNPGTSIVASNDEAVLRGGISG